MQEHAFIIPAYKDSPYLETCVLSLINQTVKSEIVLTTSTPSPFIEGLAKKYDLKYCITDKPSSIAGDWNFALSQATAKWVTLAHQDDIYNPLYTESILNEFHQRGNENILIAFTNYEDLVNHETRKSSLNAFIKSALLWPFFFSKRINNTFFKKSILLFGDPICCPTVTINLAARPTFRFSKAYSCALDWLAWIELAKQKGSFIYINKKLVQHRIHLESETTNQINNGKRRAEEQQLFEMMWGKPMAKFISKIYAIGHKDNAV
jgi:glycosyltransferase involved in cell wall biosynthesis